ncbi:MAG: hypothetical protein JL50_03730 [Peptococcaceae bacterium BICA1-7]|nr:MAG: hypothetical protein JL50_03730 [Peptococcaceae bacterium BICA1-7]HBV97623.1 hypothetical protein [Desulfotomaculum sp.]
MKTLIKEVDGMKFETDGQVGDVLDGLLKKIERLNSEKIDEYERSRKALHSLDKLTEAMSRLEQHKKKEKIMARKITQVYGYLERGTEEEGKIKTKSVSETVSGVLNVAKATGQVIEIVASSLQVMMETVTGVIKNQTSGNRGYQQNESKGLDLMSLLKPVNAIVSSLISKQQTPDPVETTRPPETKAEDAAEQAAQKEQTAGITVVKAVPAANKKEEEKT